jgi:hypothetical protein
MFQKQRNVISINSMTSISEYIESTKSQRCHFDKLNDQHFQIKLKNLNQSTIYDLQYQKFLSAHCMLRNRHGQRWLGLPAVSTF